VGYGPRQPHFQGIDKRRHPEPVKESPRASFDRLTMLTQAGRGGQNRSQKPNEVALGPSVLT
jgi:hypothetical protein